MKNNVQPLQDGRTVSKENCISANLHEKRETANAVKDKTVLVLQACICEDIPCRKVIEKAVSDSLGTVQEQG